MGRPTRYKMLRHSTIQHEAVAGTIVYSCIKHDYGLANDDSSMTGKEHKSVTLDRNGDYPYFTVPVADIEEVPYDE